MVLRENPDADLPGHHPRGARKTELGTRCVTDVISSLDPADTHHARSNNCQVKSLLLHLMWNTLARLGLTLKKSCSGQRSRRVPISPRRVANGASCSPS